MNVLILSCGTRNKIVQYFKKMLGSKGKVFATDASELAPALYEADEYYIVPRIDEPDYLETILEICQKNNITGILSLIDPELSLLVNNKDQFLEIGTTPIISEKAFIDLSFDKYEFYKHLTEEGFPTVKTYQSIVKFKDDLANEKISYPVFVKPNKGSASININKVEEDTQLDLLFNMSEDLIIQEFMDGEEYGIDAYIDLISGEVISLFIKKKIIMRAGETDKSVSVHDDDLSKLIINFLNSSGYRGIVDIDVFKVDGQYYISEVNPRFGGGYPHAYECGVNVPKMIINNLNGIKNIINYFHYEEEVFMLKYSDIKMVRL